MENQQPSANIFNRKPQKGHGFIYKYTSPSNKSYIGQTINTLKNRARNTYSGVGYKKCTIFWKAIQKYGFANFSVEILDEVPYDLLNEKEQYYIQLYDCLAPKGYNMAMGGSGGKAIPVYVYSIQNGKLIERYPSVSIASEELGIPMATISSIMHGGNVSKRRTQANNLTFRDTLVNIDLSEFQRSTSYPVYVYDKNGRFYNSYRNIEEAANALNISKTSIYGCISHTKKHTKTYQFSKEKVDSMPALDLSRQGTCVNKIDKDTYVIIKSYNSLAEAARDMGLASSSSITRAIQRGGTSKGFRWEYGEGSTTR